ncbi:MAG: cytochrome c peroxidase [Blastocatellia bacterium]
MPGEIATERVDAPAHPTGAAVEIKAPLGLPPLLIQDDNRLTADSIALGRRLFFDVRLSSDNTLSCASCHSPALHFAEGRAVAKGFNGQFGARNTPTLLNAAYNRVQFWDGRAASLEQQVGGPMSNPKEMNQSHEVSVSKLSSDPAYRAEFSKVFGPGTITMRKIEKAIASFEQTLLSGNSPFDRYRYGAEKAAISAAAIRGLAVFSDKNRGNCTACHIIGQKFALFTDGGFHNLGAGMNANGELTDLGRYEQTRAEADRGAFRTPSLRNIAKTAPYMHDGSLKTLKDVVDFYVGGGNSNPQLDKEIKSLQLTAQERNDLVVFLETLTGEVPLAAAPSKD